MKVSTKTTNANLMMKLERKAVKHKVVMTHHLENVAVCTTFLVQLYNCTT